MFILFLNFLIFFLEAILHCQKGQPLLSVYGEATKATGGPCIAAGLGGGALPLPRLEYDRKAGPAEREQEGLQEKEAAKGDCSREKQRQPKDRFGTGVQDDQAAESKKRQSGSLGEARPADRLRSEC